MILASGLLLQIGVNLINDHGDLQRVDFTEAQRRAIRRNARIGAGVIGAACLIGVWLVSLRGWPLLTLGLVGVAGLWSYAADPINLKARGLGLPAVFLLTGVLMVAGSYYAMIGSVTLDVVAWSLPFSLFAALVLLANELRDYEEDVSAGHGTFTARFGYRRGRALYATLALLIAAITLGLVLRYDAPAATPSVLALTLLPRRELDRPPEERRTLVKLTGRSYALYSLILIAALWISTP